MSFTGFFSSLLAIVAAFTVIALLSQLSWMYLLIVPPAFFALFLLGAAKWPRSTDINRNRYIKHIYLSD